MNSTVSSLAAAKAVFPAWSRMDAGACGRILLKLADQIEDNLEELAGSSRRTPVIRCATRTRSTCRAPR